MSSHHKIKKGLAKHFESYAYVTVVVQPVKHLNTQTEKKRQGG